jgi:hypothetical protein
MKCISRIVREYKKAKAKSLWPKYCPDGIYWVDNPHAEGLEVCGGEVRVEAELGWEPYYGGAESVIEIKEICSRCDFPFYDQYELVHTAVDTMSVDITALLDRNIA